MTSDRMAHLMGDPTHRTASIEDVLDRQAAAASWVPESKALPFRAIELWDAGRSLGEIQLELGISLSQTYELVHRRAE